MYTDIPVKISKDIKDECKNLNTKVGLVSKASLNPGDAHLFVVIASKNAPLFQDRPYVVWYYNSYNNSLCEGAYELTFKEALEKMHSKVR